MITDGEEISDARIKFHSTKNVAKKVIVCPTKEIDNQFDCDINATFFLCFADEALQKMVQYDEYHSDHVDIQCLQHNYLEFQQKMALQDEQAPASIVEFQDTKWATSSCFTSISQQIGRRYTRHLGSATRKRGAMSHPIQSKISTSTRHLPQGQGDRKVKSWLDDENNLIQPETDPTSSLIQKPGLSEESEKEISFSDIDSVEYKTANQSPKSYINRVSAIDTDVMFADIAAEGSSQKPSLASSTRWKNLIFDDNTSLLVVDNHLPELM
uniref:Similar to NK-TR n=1 Tax=Oikopleura dioica TaxID=34765 RepID=Q8WS41_OIKDI|nr:similar to NK-TR [Oikopleura dioica]